MGKLPAVAIPWLFWSIPIGACFSWRSSTLGPALLSHPLIAVIFPLPLFKNIYTFLFFILRFSYSATHLLVPAAFFQMLSSFRSLVLEAVNVQLVFFPVLRAFPILPSKLAPKVLRNISIFDINVVCYAFCHFQF
jgi:hypothetical protein